MTNKIALTIGALVAVGLPDASRAYEIPTHHELTDFAVGISEISKTSLQKQLGIEGIATKPLFKPFHTTNSKDLTLARPTCDIKTRMTLPQLLACGAMFEDIPGVRSLNHFFDPLTNGPLT